MANLQGTSKKIQKERLPDVISDFRNPIKSTKDKGFNNNYATNPHFQTEEMVSDIGGIFTPEVPEVEEQPIIPIPDERAQQLSSRKRRARAANSGRDSTILSDGLGG